MAYTCNNCVYFKPSDPTEAYTVGECLYVMPPWFSRIVKDVDRTVFSNDSCDLHKLKGR